MKGDVWSQFVSVAADRPAHPAIVKGDVSLSFAELRDAAIHGAARLRHAGFRRADRCVIWSENSAAMAVAILSVLACGGIVVVVNSESPQAHFRHASKMSGATHALADTARFGAAAHDGQLLPLEDIGEPGHQPPPALEPPGVHTTEPASIFFTSGSTGLPKGVTQSHQNLLWGADTVGSCLGYRADDRLVCGIPWAFDYGWGQLLSTFTLGLTHILPAARSSIALCEAIARHSPTILPGVPSLFGDLSRGVAPIRETDRDSIRLITNTGSSIPPSLFAELVELFPGAAVSLNYGLTETYRSASLPVHLAVAHSASVGRAIPGVRLIVLREDGTAAGPDEQGEIVHCGGGVFLGYWGEPEKTALVRRPDPLWVHHGVDPPMAVFTGDLGWFDGGGLLHIHGRRDRQIKSMGVRVSPDEVEALVHASGLAREVAVFARPHDIIGEMVVAAIVPTGDGGEAVRALKKFARASMSQYMQPREWHVVDALPRTASAKVDYPALKRQFSSPERT